MPICPYCKEQSLKETFKDFDLECLNPWINLSFDCTSCGKKMWAQMEITIWYDDEGRPFLEKNKTKNKKKRQKSK